MILPMHMIKMHFSLISFQQLLRQTKQWIAMRTKLKKLWWRKLRHKGSEFAWSGPLQRIKMLWKRQKCLMYQCWQVKMGGNWLRTTHGWLISSWTASKGRSSTASTRRRSNTSKFSLQISQAPFLKLPRTSPKNFRPASSHIRNKKSRRSSTPQPPDLQLQHARRRHCLHRHPETRRVDSTGAPDPLYGRINTKGNEQQSDAFDLLQRLRW